MIFYFIENVSKHLISWICKFLFLYVFIFYVFTSWFCGLLYLMFLCFIFFISWFLLSWNSIGLVLILVIIVLVSLNITFNSHLVLVSFNILNELFSRWTTIWLLKTKPFNWCDDHHHLASWSQSVIICFTAWVMWWVRCTNVS